MRLRSLTGPIPPRLTSTALLAAVWATATTAATAQTILQVDTTTDSAVLTACLDAVANDCSLRGAILTANSIPDGTDVVIELPSQTHTLTIDGPNEAAGMTGDLDVHRSMTIRRQSGLPRIDGGGAGGLDDRLIELHGVGTLLQIENVILRNSQPPADLHAINVSLGTTLHFTGGRIETSGTLASGGGAVRVAPLGAATFTDTTIWFNNGLQGGGVRSSGQVTFTGTLLRSNFGTNGGAVALLSGPTASALFEDCHLDNNNAIEDGGAVWAGEDTSLTIRRTLAEDNDAFIAPIGRGGAVFARGGVLIEDSTFLANQADRGAAVHVEGMAGSAAQLDVVNSTFSANETLLAGWAAIVVEDGTAEMLFTTHAGQFLDLLIDAQSNLSTAGSLYDGGCFAFPGGIFSSGGGNLAPHGVCWAGAPNVGDLVFANLDLLPLGPYDGPTPTHLPRPTSPAVGAVSAPCLGLDQRGLPRPVADCTAGAVERQAVESFLFGDDFSSGDVSQWSTAVP
ncbi:MAG: hypothetical protein DWQ36_09025 [Acidobacteria bacterium]|nr:MAG: hypothetical protein DWQ30_22270 [Acidobacteriota bacterium]REK08503.1 MAG: hypothetical protein DWQ36_09025 [Acidobacteriota bacterium]